MKQFTIETTEHPAVDFHPELANIRITWLRWDHPGGITRINVDYACDVLMDYLGRELDIFEYIQALDFVKEFPQRQPKSSPLKSIKESVAHYG